MIQTQYPLFCCLSSILMCQILLFLFPFTLKPSTFTIMLLKYALLLTYCPASDVIGYQVNEDRSLIATSHLPHLPFRVSEAYGFHSIHESSVLPFLVTAVVRCCLVWALTPLVCICLPAVRWGFRWFQIKLPLVNIYPEGHEKSQEHAILASLMHKALAHLSRVNPWASSEPSSAPSCFCPPLEASCTDDDWQPRFLSQISWISVYILLF